MEVDNTIETAGDVDLIFEYFNAEIRSGAVHWWYRLPSGRSLAVVVSLAR